MESRLSPVSKIQACTMYGNFIMITIAAMLMHSLGAHALNHGIIWLRTVRLDWRTVARMSSHTVSAILEDQIAAEQIPGGYRDSLGTITPFRALLTMKPDAQPKFFKPRPVPFALKERVENVIN